MNYALVGFGRMGRAVDAAAADRGHRRVLIVDRSARGRKIARSIDRARWRGIDVAFEFTEAPGAADRVAALLRAGVAVVCGTTGWEVDDPGVRRAARASKAGAVIAPNFSVAVTLFTSLVGSAAAAFSRAGEFDPYVLEVHHRAKLDAPSGTARRLARGISEAAAGRAAETVPVASVRAGHEAGRHTVGFDGPYDIVTLTHQARGRSGFAGGAVLAAEWIAGRRGVHEFDEVCSDLLRGGRRGRSGGRR